MKKPLLYILFILSVFRLSGQINTDSIFNSAIIQAQQGNYDKAIKEASTVLTILSDRYDIMIFISNVYAWKGDYTSALDQIEKTYTLNKNSKELYDAWLNILLWSKKYKQLIEIAETAKQNYYTDNYNLVLKKTLAYKALGEYNNGINLIDSNKNYLDSVKIKNLYNEMLMLHKSKAVSLYYTISFFEKNTIKPQHFFYVDYSFKIKKQTLIARLNYANRFENNDFQIEADYYHLLKNGQYLYANYGLSIFNELFPKHRGGFEYFFPVFKSMESSIGGRYLNSNNTNVIILTGHLSKYFKNLWFSLRPFYVMHHTQNTITTVFNARYYSRNPLNYWGLELVNGNTPDERFTIVSPSDVYLLKNYRVKIEKNHLIFKSKEIKLTAAYIFEEFQTNSFRNRFAIEILFKYRF